MNVFFKVLVWEDDDCVYVFGTPKADEGFWKIQTVVAPHDENKVIKEQRSVSTNVPRKDSAYDSRKIQYNCVKNSTKSNLLNLHHTNYPTCLFYFFLVSFTTHISWKFPS